MKDIITVAKFTMRDMLSRKAFRISTIIIVILIVLGFNLPAFINNITGGDTKDTILISDPENQFSEELNRIISAQNSQNQNIELPASQPSYKLEQTEDNLDAIKEKINRDEVKAAIILNSTKESAIVFQYYVKNTALANTNDLDTITKQIKAQYINTQISKLHLTTEQLQSINPVISQQIEQTDDQQIGGNIVVTMLLSVLLFFAIYFCAFQVSSSITVEKTSKIIETLVTSTSPRSIIIGKTIGIGLVGLMQILLFVITAIISAKLFLDPELLNQMFDLSNFTPYLALITLVYFILGYFAYALLYALTGSTVAKPEDIQSANTPVVIVTMIGFYLAYFTLTDPTSDLNIFASLLPISSPFCMPLRVMMGLATGWEVLLSVVILLVFCFIVAKIAIKIYSNAILNYGTKMTIADIIKSYKEK